MFPDNTIPHFIEQKHHKTKISKSVDRNAVTLLKDKLGYCSITNLSICLSETSPHFTTGLLANNKKTVYLTEP